MVRTDIRVNRSMHSQGTHQSSMISAYSHQLNVICCDGPECELTGCWGAEPPANFQNFQPHAFYIFSPRGSIKPPVPHSVHK